MSDKLQDIARECQEILEAGADHITLVFNKGCSWRGMGFGRGELLCEQRDGRRAYRFKASKVLAAIKGATA
jgi:hypothetical protein